MNAKELIQILNEHNLDTWRPYVYSLNPNQLIALRREMQKGLSRLKPSKIINPYSTDPLQAVQNKTLNYISYIEHAFRYYRKIELNKQGADKNHIRAVIEEELVANAY